MKATRARFGWAIAAAAVGMVAWPLATGAGLALSAAALFAGLRAGALVVLVIAVALAAAGMRIDADERERDRPPPAHRPK